MRDNFVEIFVIICIITTTAIGAMVSLRETPAPKAEVSVMQLAQEAANQGDFLK